MIAELPTALTGALEAAFNRYLRLDPEAPSRIARLSGKVIELVVEDWNLRLFLIPAHDGVQILSRCEQPPDTVLYTSPLTLWQLARGGDAAELMLRQEMRIEGDTQVGQSFRRVLEQMDIDWEEHLSGFMGDVLAHQVMRGARAGSRWFASTSQSLEQDVTEFLQEETRIVPGAQEVLTFMDDVDHLRTDVDRLEARLRRLRARLEQRAQRTDS